MPPAQIPTQALDRHDGYRHPRPERHTASSSAESTHDWDKENGKGKISGQLEPSDLAAAGIAQAMTARPKHAAPENGTATFGADMPTVQLRIGEVSIGLPLGRANADTDADTYGRHALIPPQPFVSEQPFGWFEPTNEP